jgi:hypothetical protein
VVEGKRFGWSVEKYHIITRVAGLSSVGLFRVPGLDNEIKSLVESFNSGRKTRLPDDPATVGAFLRLSEPALLPGCWALEAVLPAVARSADSGDLIHSIHQSRLDRG